MRYALEHPAYLDMDGGVVGRMAQKMHSDIGHALRDPDASPAGVAEEVRRLIKHWRPSGPSC